MIRCEKCGEIAEKNSKRWCKACRSEAQREADALRMKITNDTRNNRWKTFSAKKQLKLIAECAEFYKHSNAKRKYKLKGRRKKSV